MTCLIFRKGIGMKIDYVVWDFNGTILDDVETGIRSVNRLLLDRNLRPIASKEEYREIFGFPIMRYYERLGFDFSKEPYEVIAPLWVEQYLKNVKEAEAFSDVKQTLEAFRERGIRQAVLSATEKGMLEKQLTDLGLLDYFDEIWGLDNIHAASKTALAKSFREKHLHDKMIYLGDTDHDVESARAMGADCYLIARGHQSEARLRRLGVPMFPDLTSFYETVLKE